MKTGLIIFILLSIALTEISATNIPPAPMGPEPPPGGDIGGMWILLIAAIFYGIIKKLYKNKLNLLEKN